MIGVGARIRERCRDLRISEAEAARRSGISARRFSFYVNDQREPNFETLLAICKALDITPNYLFGIDAGSDPTAEMHPTRSAPTAQSSW